MGLVGFSQLALLAISGKLGKVLWELRDEKSDARTTASGFTSRVVTSTVMVASTSIRWLLACN
jgi:outer membrane protein assembly factor BamB